MGGKQSKEETLKKPAEETASATNEPADQTDGGVCKAPATSTTSASDDVSDVVNDDNTATDEKESGKQEPDKPHTDAASPAKEETESGTVRRRKTRGLFRKGSDFVAEKIKDVHGTLTRKKKPKKDTSEAQNASASKLGVVLEGSEKDGDQDAVRDEKKVEIQPKLGFRARMKEKVRRGKDMLAKIWLVITSIEHAKAYVKSMKRQEIFTAFLLLLILMIFWKLHSIETATHDNSAQLSKEISDSRRDSKENTKEILNAVNEAKEETAREVQNAKESVIDKVNQQFTELHDKLDKNSDDSTPPTGAQDENSNDESQTDEEIKKQAPKIETQRWERLATVYGKSKTAVETGVTAVTSWVSSSFSTAWNYVSGSSTTSKEKEASKQAETIGEAEDNTVFTEEEGHVVADSEGIKDDASHSASVQSE